MKHNTKDSAVKIGAIIFAGLLIYGIDEFSDANNKGIKFTKSAIGIGLQAIGFLLILWSSKTKVHLKADSISKYEGKKARILSAITYPKTYEIGLSFVFIGLLFEFISLDWSN